jgi:hypothetical protein
MVVRELEMNGKQLRVLLIDVDEDSRLITQGLLSQVRDAVYALEVEGQL